MDFKTNPLLKQMNKNRDSQNSYAYREALASFEKVHFIYLFISRYLAH